MTYKERLLKVIQSIHISEKTSMQSEKYNTFVFRVAKHTNKTDIKDAVRMLFSVEINHINTITVSGKYKRISKKNHFGRRDNWKKAYVTLKKGQKIDFINTK
ncbi:50S ribosomal protein L23 [Candidatus Blochmannia ocreatus (nom. nud.)]|uniref:Large ribosomal subunit protein uL23 n=1 Tax=Candidatus Blochmannia ocreatus (nom. nud.) TaxID=251538 RepID=A0ABY4SWD8_9ENTR|nr:50S ribosomal protein L23 [Candidatus Blochmannia ocreatus]URJ25270.1 50S ribosomal protein L23 [Candidatus Blochmannia ocreatus]